MQISIKMVTQNNTITINLYDRRLCCLSNAIFYLAVWETLESDQLFFGIWLNYILWFLFYQLLYNLAKIKNLAVLKKSCE